MGNPVMGKQEVYHLAMLVKPLRHAMRENESNPDTKHHVFQGWMPSDLFLRLAAAHCQDHDLNTLCKAISTVQCRVNTSTEEPDPQAVPMVQVLWQGSWKASKYFISLHPQLRRAF